MRRSTGLRGHCCCGWPVSGTGPSRTGGRDCEVQGGTRFGSVVRRRCRAAFRREPRCDSLLLARRGGGIQCCNTFAASWGCGTSCRTQFVRRELPTRLHRPAVRRGGRYREIDGSSIRTRADSESSLLATLSVPTHTATPTPTRRDRIPARSCRQTSAGRGCFRQGQRTVW